MTLEEHRDAGITFCRGGLPELPAADLASLDEADRLARAEARKKLQVPKGSHPVPSTASTTPVHCAGGKAGKSEQENVIEEGKTCYLEEQDMCNSIWKKGRSRNEDMD